MVKNLPAVCRSYRIRGIDSWVRKIPWRRAWKPTPVFLPGESREQRRLAGYCPQDRKELDTTEATQPSTAQTSLLLWIMLQWTCECKYLFSILFSILLNIYTKMGLLDLTVVLFLTFWGASILFSIVAIPFYIPTNSIKGSHFSTPSSTTCYFLDLFLFIFCFCLCFCFIMAILSGVR